MKKNSKIKLNGIEMTLEFKSLNHRTMGCYRYDYADWHLKNESDRLDINYEDMLRVCCSCLSNKIDKRDIKDIVLRKFLVEIEFHVSKKLNGDYNVVVERAEKAYVL